MQLTPPSTSLFKGWSAAALALAPALALASGPAAAQTPPTFQLGNQAPDAPADEPGESTRMAINSLDLIVNDQCLTRGDVMMEVMRGQPPGSAEELSQRMEVVLNRQVEQLLKTQAGKDLGFEPGMVQRLVEDDLERRKDGAGSSAKLGEQLSRSRFDSASFYENTESRILAQLWTRSVDGRFPGPGGRHYVDRFVRPGRLKFEYERNKGLMALPATVVLQEIAIDAQRIGDLGEAAALAEDLHERITILGEDFGEVGLAARAVPEDTKGVLTPIEEERLRPIPGMGPFLDGAEPGDVSKVMPVRSPDGVLRGFRIVKLLERDRPEPPPFADQDFQVDLTERIQESLDQGRADAALNDLLQAAYVWPPEAFGRRQDGQGNAATDPSSAPQGPDGPGQPAEGSQPRESQADGSAPAPGKRP